VERFVHLGLAGVWNMRVYFFVFKLVVRFQIKPVVAKEKGNFLLRLLGIFRYVIRCELRGGEEPKLAHFSQNW